jgi:hypothetical protein
MPNFHSMAEYVLHFMQTWSMVISNPKHFLAPLFHPQDRQAIDGLEFYFATLAFSFVLQAPFVLGQKGEFGEKARLAASSVVGLVSSAVIAMAWHFAFSWLGGSATFTGTCLAYVYAGAPYIPLLSLASLITFAALPADLQHYALNPATAQSAIKRGMTDPRTRKGLVVLGSLAFLGIIVCSTVVQLRTMSFVHGVTGWRAVWCIIVSLVLAGVVAPLLKAIASVFNPPPEVVTVEVVSAKPTTPEGSIAP